MKSILGIIMLVGAVVIVVVFVRPQLSEISAIKSELSTYSSALDKAKLLRTERERLLGVYNNLDAARVARLQKMLPSDIDNVKLALEIENVASSLGLRLKGIDVKDPTEQSAAARVASANQVQSPYGTAEISFTVVGGYSEFTEFMKKIETSLRLIDVQRVQFTAPRGVNVPQNVFEFRVAVTTYWLRDELVTATYE
jgi:Tfp pilus assembly protein PilO